MGHASHKCDSMNLRSKLAVSRTISVNAVSRGFRLGITLVIFCFNAYPSAAAQAPSSLPDLKQLSLEQLMNVEVTSVAKKEQRVAETAAAIFVITQEDIRRSGVTSIPEALRLAPGVEVSRIDANKWSVGVRGFGSRLSRSVLVLMDGRSVYTPLFAGVYWEIQDTLLEDIDRIEVIHGIRPWSRIVCSERLPQSRKRHYKRP